MARHTAVEIFAVLGELMYRGGMPPETPVRFESNHTQKGVIAIYREAEQEVVVFEQEGEDNVKTH